jgi:hypothetical protein
MTTTTRAVSASLLVLFSGLAAAVAQPFATPVSSTFHPGTSTITVPGVGDRTFSSYNGLFRSPNGQRWIFIGNLSGDTATNRVIVAGALSGGAFINQGQVVARKGAPIPTSTRTVNILDNPRINDAGQFAFSSNSSGTGTPSIFFFTGSVDPTPTFAPAAAVTDPIPFVPGATYTGGFNSTLLDNSGRWGFAVSINEASIVTRAIVFNNTLIARTATPALAPTLLPGAPAQDWSDFTLRRVFVDSSGNNLFWTGTIGILPNPVTDVAALNNTAVAQQTLALPGDTATTLGGFTSGWLEPDGQWFIRATESDNTTDVVIRNGAVVARRAQPITPGATETWERASASLNGFLFNVGNSAGDYVICGNTTAGAAAVLNGQTVVARRGDPVDLNANGLDDDNAYIRGFKSEVGPGTAFLTNSRELWMVIDVETDAGIDLGDAIVRLQLPSACPADFNGVGGITVQDIFDFLAAYFNNNPRADFNNAGGVTVQDIFDFLAAYFAGCP